MFSSLLTPTHPQPNYFFQSLAPQYKSPYSPNQPSPLRTSRNANLMPQSFATDTPQKSFNTSNKRSSPSPATHLSRLVSAKKDARKTAHRDRAADRRADAYLDERNDQVSRIEWMREQRKWEERMRKLGQRETVYEDPDVQEMEGDERTEDETSSDMITQNGEMPVPTEEEEMEALIGLLGTEEKVTSGDRPLAGDDTNRQTEDQHSLHDTTYTDPLRRTSQVYVSDEEDYDQLFMEVIKSSQADPDGSKEGRLDEAMDLS